MTPSLCHYTSPTPPSLPWRYCKSLLRKNNKQFIAFKTHTHTHTHTHKHKRKASAQQYKHLCICAPVHKHFIEMRVITNITTIRTTSVEKHNSIRQIGFARLSAFKALASGTPRCKLAHMATYVHTYVCAYRQFWCIEWRALIVLKLTFDPKSPAIFQNVLAAERSAEEIAFENWVRVLSASVRPPWKSPRPRQASDGVDTWTTNGN